jgi:hypothetical protein
MTWNELKDKIDNKLKENNKTGDIEIGYFDFSGNPYPESRIYEGPDVYIDDELTVTG